MSGLSNQKLKELKAFLEQVKANPQLLHLEELSFFKDFLLHFKADIPSAFKTQSSTSTKVDVENDMPDLVDEPTTNQPNQEEEEKIEQDPGLIVPDEDQPLDVGDQSVEVTEEMLDEANTLRGQATGAQKSGDFAKSVELLTQAIKLNPRSGILYGSRAQALLDMRKPNAAIRDCDVAIKISPDSAKPYKVRGRAHRALGNYEQAIKDIQTGQKLDFDPESHKFENELKELKEKYSKNKKSSQSSSNQQQQQSTPKFGGANPFEGLGGGGEGQNPFGIDPNLMQKIMSDPEVISLMRDPSALNKIQEAMSNPAKLAELASDPRFANLMSKFK